MTTRPFTTNDAGIPAASDEHSLTIGPDGPILLQDHYLIQKMAHFNRERVPERVVHAKGGGAFGRFECMEDVSAFTRAAMFQKGASTKSLLRFSTVAMELGSPDTVRDPRGFALKFYTTEGNYDLVGNNTPIFFIRDPQKFSDFIHSQKRRADNQLRDPNNMWDFWTLSPESSHQVTFLFTDRGTPRTWRHQHGFGSHTFMWINAGGEKFWVKYHFKTDQGIETFGGAEASDMVREDTDFHRRDLWASIKSGDHPSWTLEVQVMPFADAAEYRFNPFDLTKVWPHGDYPPVQVGRLTLDTNPEDYFAQIEQAAFEPSSFVRGTGPSPDKMLVGRMFSYPDAHRYRIGANYQQLPVNQPIAAVHSYNRDGAMRYSNPADPVYAPNSYGGPAAEPQLAGEPTGLGFEGEVLRSAYTPRKDDDDTTQAGTLIREVLTQPERDALVANVIEHVNGGVTAEIKPRVVDYWTAIDPTVGAQVKAGILDAP